MSIELVEATLSLSAILDQENELLALGGHHAELGTLVSAKLRLAGIIDAESVRLGVVEEWSDTLGEGGAGFSDTLKGLLDKLAINADLLRRRMELCDEIMGAVAAEARRLTGARSVTYGAHGALARSDQAVPIAVNTSL